MKPGIYPNFPEADYHDLDAISSSGLARIDKSPAHYRIPLTPSPSMMLGSIVHCLVLEPGEFDKRYAIAPEGDRRKKEVKAAWAEFEKTLGDRQAVKEPLYEQANSIAARVVEHDDAAALLLDERRETSVIWQEQGALCKARPDLLTASGACDIKTTRDASPDGFARAIASYLYHQQAAHYLRGLAAHKLPAESWQWIAAETEPPFAVGVYTASTDMLIEGDRRRARNLSRLLACRFADDWPAYESQTLDLPGWAHLSESEWSEAA